VGVFLNTVYKLVCFTSALDDAVLDKQLWCLFSLCELMKSEQFPRKKFVFGSRESRRHWHKYNLSVVVIIICIIAIAYDVEILIVITCCASV